MARSAPLAPGPCGVARVGGAGAQWSQSLAQWGGGGAGPPAQSCFLARMLEKRGLWLSALGPPSLALTGHRAPYPASPISQLRKGPGSWERRARARSRLTLAPGVGTNGGCSGKEAPTELRLFLACKLAPGQSHRRGGQATVRCSPQPSTTCGLASRVSGPGPIPSSHSNSY